MTVPIVATAMSVSGPRHGGPISARRPARVFEYWTYTHPYDASGFLVFVSFAACACPPCLLCRAYRGVKW